MALAIGQPSPTSSSSSFSSSSTSTSSSASYSHHADPPLPPPPSSRLLPCSSSSYSPPSLAVLPESESISPSLLLSSPHPPPSPSPCPPSSRAAPPPLTTPANSELPSILPSSFPLPSSPSVTALCGGGVLSNVVSSLQSLVSRVQGGENHDLQAIREQLASLIRLLDASPLPPPLPAPLRPAPPSPPPPARPLSPASLTSSSIPLAFPARLTSALSDSERDEEQEGGRGEEGETAAPLTAATVTDCSSPSSSSTASSTSSPSHIQLSKVPLKVLYVKVQRQFTVTRRQAKAMTQAEREGLVPVPVRLMMGSSSSTPHLVARDVCMLIHLRQGSVSKVLHAFTAAERSRVPILCQRATGGHCTQVLTVLSMAGVTRLLTSSPSPLAPHVLLWLTQQVDKISKEGAAVSTTSKATKRRREGQEMTGEEKGRGRDRAAMSSPSSSPIVRLDEGKRARALLDVDASPPVSLSPRSVLLTDGPVKGSPAAVALSSSPSSSLTSPHSSLSHSHAFARGSCVMELSRSTAIPQSPLLVPHPHYPPPPHPPPSYPMASQHPSALHPPHPAHHAGAAHLVTSLLPTFHTFPYLSSAAVQWPFSPPPPLAGHLPSPLSALPPPHLLRPVFSFPSPQGSTLPSSASSAFTSTSVMLSSPSHSTSSSARFTFSPTAFTPHALQPIPAT